MNRNLTKKIIRKVVNGCSEWWGWVGVAKIRLLLLFFHCLRSIVFIPLFYDEDIALFYEEDIALFDDEDIVFLYFTVSSGHPPFRG